MKKFLTKIIIYFLIFVFSTSLFVYILDKNFKHSEHENFKEWNDIFNHRVNAQVIIQGNSRAFFQYNTYILDSILNTNSYNFGLDGTPFNMQYARYQVYIKSNPCPKIIIQNLDPLTLVRSTAVPEKYQYLPYLDNKDLQSQLLKDGLSYYDIYMPFLKYSGQKNIMKIGLLESLGIKHFKSTRYKGFNNRNENWNGTELNEVKKSGEKLYWRIDPDVLVLFRGFMNDCAERNIKPILVFAPMYKDAIQLTTNFNGFILQCQDLAREYNCPFLDYSKDSICLDTAYFYNAFHMNSVGNKKFTTKLALKIKEMNLLN